VDLIASITQLPAKAKVIGHLRAAFCFLLLGYVLDPVHAATSQLLVTTAASPGAYNSTVSNTVVETFDNLASTGNSPAFTNTLVWTNVGTFTGLTNNNVQFNTADQYGGAPNPTNSAIDTSYLAAFSNSPVKLSLNTNASYFGMWWSAGDAANTLKFYSGGTNGTLIATFTTADLSLLSTNYNGNPTTQFSGQNTGEKYTFLNFYAQQGTSFDTIVATETNASGFESDNWTIRNAAYGLGPGDGPTDPGTPLVQYFVTNGVQTISKSNFQTAADTVAVPEPSQVAASILLLVGVAGFLVYRKRIDSRFAEVNL